MDVFREEETAYMRRALELARNGEGRVGPNPPVGCVLVRDGRVVAEGWHDHYGGLHAEGMALASLPPGGAKGTTAYVTLSPCATRGKQPPCADALADAGVREVVAATRDPNPQNACGLEKLRQMGVPCRLGLLAGEAEYLARGFFSRQRAGRPYVTLKYAMTLDGKIAAASGDSRWISGAESREVVQDMRSRSDAVMVGIGTVLADDPLLNVRDPVWSRRGGDGKHRQPLRVVVDSHCRTPPSSLILDRKNHPGGDVLIAALDGTDSPRGAVLAEAGAEVLSLPALDGRIRLASLLEALGKRGVNLVLCEGGGGLAAGLARENLLDDIVLFIAPKIVGGRCAPGPIEDLGIQKMADAMNLQIREYAPVGPDLMLRATLV